MLHPGAELLGQTQLRNCHQKTRGRRRAGEGDGIERAVRRRSAQPKVWTGVGRRLPAVELYLDHGRACLTKCLHQVGQRFAVQLDRYPAAS